MKPKYRFLINKGHLNYQMGYGYNAVGVKYANNNNKCTDILPVQFVYRLPWQALGRICYYDSDKNYISRYDFSPSPITKINSFVYPPKKAAFISITISFDDGNILQKNAIIDGYDISTPIYSNDLSLDIEQENGYQFYRKKLNGKLIFLKEDYDYIVNSPIDTQFGMCIQQTMGAWVEIFQGLFTQIDCVINHDDLSVTAQISPTDEYDEILEKLDEEIDVLELPLATTEITLKKQPLIQVYFPGQTKIGCFVGGMSWMQDCEAVSDENTLVNHMYFSKNSSNIQVVLSNGQKYSGATYDTSNTTHTNTFNQVGGTNILQFVCHENKFVKNPISYWILKNSSGNEIASSNTTSKVSYDFELRQNNSIYATGYVENSTFYTRVLTANAVAGDYNPYLLPSDDLVQQNRNYLYAIGLAMKCIYINTLDSATPTKYGKKPNGRYYAPPPLSLGLGNTYPLYPELWGDYSMWFYYPTFWKLGYENDFTGYNQLKDAYGIDVIIRALIDKLDLNLIHPKEVATSQYLYGDSPLSGVPNLNIYLTQVTNITVGNYTQPAQTQKTTLGKILKILEQSLKAYWFIDGGVLRIEHIQYFYNGMSYNRQPGYAIDLTSLYNPQNKKSLVFGTNEIQFDKSQMPKQYTYEWGNEVSDIFNGLPMVVRSKIVQQDKIENISLSGVTTDVLYTELNPNDVLKDGFVMMWGEYGELLSAPDSYPYGSGHSLGLLNTNNKTPLYKLITIGKPGTYTIDVRCTQPVYVQFHLLNGAYLQDTINMNGKTTLTVSFDFDGVRLVNNGNNTNLVYLLGLTSSGDVGLTLPTIEKTIDGVDYDLYNGRLSMPVLQETVLPYEMPAHVLNVNNMTYYAKSVARNKKQNIKFPSFINIQINKLIKTGIGDGEIEKISINLTDLIATTTLRYATE